MMGGVEERIDVAVDGGSLEVLVAGSGLLVILVPSLGRGAGDFDDLAGHLIDAGYRVARPQPRGIGGSSAPLADLSMATLASDVAAVIVATGEDGSPGRGPATVVGHAFGNRVVRMVATQHPELVAGVVLLAAGGLVPPGPEAAAALRDVFTTAPGSAEHLAAVRTAFFAPGNDPSVWDGGWYPEVATAQGAATRATDAATWWSAGDAPVLVVQPADDVVAVPANAERLAAELVDRVTVVTIADAGHALLPEQPDAVADAVIAWLADQDRADPHHVAP